MSIRDFQDRRRRDHIIFSWPVFVIALVFIVVVGIGLFRLWQKKQVIDEEIVRFESVLSKIEERRQGFESTFEELKTPEGIDREARSRFSLKKPGEHVAIFVNEKPPDTLIPSQAGAANFFYSVWSWITNLF